jgi:hypothetical protein
MSELMLDAETKEQVFERLAKELETRIGASRADVPAFLRAIRGLPVGLRAMAATYELDVSITLDDLAWHFRNWYDHDLAQETLRGLRELEAAEAADLFEQAYRVISGKWEEFGRYVQAEPAEYNAWAKSSGLQAAIDPLNDRIWALADAQDPKGLFGYWVAYARKYPERING